MLAKVNSFILLGIEAQLCEVEVDAAQHGMEKTVVVGLARAAVKESIERVRRASSTAAIRIWPITCS